MLDLTLCSNSLDTLLKVDCVVNSENSKNSGKFSLTVDHRTDQYYYELDIINSRITLFNKELKLINIPSKNLILPNLCAKNNPINLYIYNAFFKEICNFYKSFIKTIMETGVNSKIHIILNNIHVLLIGNVIKNNRGIIIGASMIEIPYKDTEILNYNDNA